MRLTAVVKAESLTGAFGKEFIALLRHYQLPQIQGRAGAFFCIYLRQLQVPLAQIKAILPLEPVQAADRVREFWAATDAEHTARRALAADLIDELSKRRDQACLPQLAGLIEAVARVLIHSCRRQQTQPVIEPQRLRGQPRASGEPPMLI